MLLMYYDIIFGSLEELTLSKLYVKNTPIFPYPYTNKMTWIARYGCKIRK